MDRTQFDSWRKLLALRQANPTRAAFKRAMIDAKLTMDSDDPMSGYWRKPQSKGAVLEPVGIWRDAHDVLIIEWRGVVYDNVQARLTDTIVEEIFKWSDWEPIEYPWYEGKVYRGEEWPDVHSAGPEEAELDGIEELIGRAGDGRVAAMGDNSGEIDEALILQGKIDEAKRGVKQYAKIASDEQRAQSQTLRSDLLKLAGQAKKTRESLLQPHKDATKAINEKWKPLEEAAQAGADAIRAAQEAWGTLKIQRQREEEAKAAAERARIEAEAAARAEAAQAAVDRGEAPPEPSLPLAPLPEPIRVAPQTSFRGGTGRAAHEKAVNVIAEVTDWPALFAYFTEDASARDFILRRAQSVLKATGEIPPGCRIEERAKVA